MAVEVVLLESMTGNNMSWNPGDVYPADDKAHAARLIERGIARPIEELEAVRKSFHIVPPALSPAPEGLEVTATPLPKAEEAEDEAPVAANGELPPLPTAEEGATRRPGRARKS